MTSHALLSDLLSLRELLAVPERWTQGNSAENSFGELVDYRSLAAVRFCVLGGIWRVAGETEIRRAALYQSVLWQLPDSQAGRPPLNFWNDSPSRTHSEVLALIDKAIEAARAAEVS